MKTVFEETENGLPSFQTERPNSTEIQRELECRGPERRPTDWAARRLQDVVEWENAWRGFREYDSPLAG